MERVHLSDFGIKLMEYFFAKWDQNEILVVDPSALPPALRQLFCGENGKMSLIPISKLVPQITTVTVTRIGLIDITKNAKEYIESIREWAMHCEAATTPDTFCRVEFRSAAQKGLRKEFTVNSVVDEFEDELAAKGWSLQYECKGNQHSISSQRINVAVDTEAADIDIDPATTRSFELSLDVDPILVAQFSDDEKREFGEIAVQSVVGEVDVEEGVNVEVDPLTADRNGVKIPYRVIVADAATSTIGEVVQCIEETADFVDHIEFKSMMLPVHGHEATTDLSFTERLLKDDADKMAKKEEDEKLTATLQEVADDVELSNVPGLGMDGLSAFKGLKHGLRGGGGGGDGDGGGGAVSGQNVDEEVQRRVAEMRLKVEAEMKEREQLLVEQKAQIQAERDALEETAKTTKAEAEELETERKMLEEEAQRLIEQNTKLRAEREQIESDRKEMDEEKKSGSFSKFLCFLRENHFDTKLASSGHGA